jgi:protein TonB
MRGMYAPGQPAAPARLKPLAAIAAAHLLLFYAIHSGLLQRVAQVTLPAAMLVSFVAAPVAPPPRPAAPPTLAPSVLPPALSAPLPLIQIAPVDNALSAAPAAATPAAPSDKAPIVTAATSAPAAPPPGPRTISAGVDYLQPPQLVYPALSKRLGEQGRVVLRVLVNDRGQPEQVQVQTSSGFARLDEAGRQAVLRALFKPQLQDGHAVSVFVIVPLNFQMTS